MKPLLYLWLPALLWSGTAAAQRLDLEKTHDVSRKARRGYLSDVTVQKNDHIYLEFVTKSTDKEVKTQTYHFSPEFDLVDVAESTKAVEKVKGYRGENFSKEAITLELAGGAEGAAAALGPLGGLAGLAGVVNPTGTLLLRHKRIDYKWNWLTGGYRKKVKLLETIKPKAESGAGYHHVAHVDDEVNGGVLVLATENIKLSKARAFKPGFHLLYFDKDANLTRDTYLEPGSSTSQTFVQMQALALDRNEEADDSQLPSADVALVLTYPKGTGKDKGLHPATEYQYLRCTADGQLKETIRIDSPVSAWVVSGFVPLADKSVLLYGPANDANDKYYADALPEAQGDMTPQEAFKGKNFLLGKISGGRVAWITKTPLKEFEEKQRAPEGQKRIPEYTGKRFMVQQAVEAPNGDLLISGQNFKYHKGGFGGNKMLNTVTGTKGAAAEPYRTYHDMLLFQFDKEGHLRTQFGLKPKETNSFAEKMPTGNYLSLSANGKHLYWTLYEIDGMREADKETNGLFDLTVLESISYPTVVRVDLDKSTMGEHKAFGVTKEGKYYVNNQYTTIPVGDERKQHVFFGESKNGKTMWFARMPLE